MDINSLYFDILKKNFVFKFLTFLNNTIIIKCINLFLNEIFELQAFIIFFLILWNKKKTINLGIIIEDR